MPLIKRTISEGMRAKVRRRTGIARSVADATLRELIAAGAVVVWFAGWLEAIYDEVRESVGGCERVVTNNSRQRANEEDQRAEEK
jgi:hypothetical protein